MRSTVVDLRAGPEQRERRAAPGGIDLVLNIAMTFIASWTVIYVIAAWWHFAARLAFLIWVVTTPLCVWLTRRVSPHFDKDSRITIVDGIPLLAVAAVSVAVLVGVIVAQQHWLVAHTGLTVPVWLLAISSLGLGIASSVAWQARRTAERPPRRTGGRSVRRAPGASTAVMAVALLLSLFSLFVVRHDGDDTYYANRSEYVVQHGVFPSRDTIFANQAYPNTEPAQVSSYEGFVGAFGNSFGISAGAIDAYLVTPAGTFLAVLALWRLLVAWGARRPLVALCVAVVFLLMDGDRFYGFGNLFLARMWQGKVLFVSLAIPVIYSQLSAWSERRERRGLVLLAIAGVGAVGLTSTALFLIPLIAAVGLAPLLLERAIRSFALGWLCLCGYSIAVAGVLGFNGVGIVPPSGYPAGNALVVAVTGTGVVGALGVTAALAGWVGFDFWRGRLTAALASLTAVVLVAPAVMTAFADLSDVSQVMWRLMWVTPLPALVGALVTAALGRGRGAMPMLGSALAVLVVGAVVLTGDPIWSTSNGAALVTWPTWKFSPSDLSGARAISRIVARGEEILAPSSVSEALTVVTTLAYTVDPRSDYVRDLSSQSGFHARDRLLLEGFANGEPIGHGAPAIEGALRVLDVGMACADAGDRPAISLLREADYVHVWSSPVLACLGRPALDRA